MHDDPNKEKDKLLKFLDEVEDEAKRIESAGKDLIQNARLMGDTAKPLRDLYEYTPVSELLPTEWSRQAENMRSWLGAARSIQPGLTDISSFGVMTQAVTNTSASGVMPLYPLFEAITPAPSSIASSSPYPAVVQRATAKLATIFEKYPSLEKARAAIRRLGLDSKGGTSKSAFESLEDARQALEIPVVDEGGGVAVLIGLRECINTCFSDLIRRRPVQEKTKNWKEKVESLGRHCGLHSLDPAHFANLGTEAESMIDRLSGAKQEKLSRADIQWQFNQGLLFIASFLDSIDVSKLRA